MDMLSLSYCCSTPILLIIYASVLISLLHHCIYLLCTVMHKDMRKLQESSQLIGLAMRALVSQLSAPPIPLSLYSFNYELSVIFALRVYIHTYLLDKFLLSTILISQLLLVPFVNQHLSNLCPLLQVLCPF